MKKAVFCLISVLFVWGCAHKYERIYVGDAPAYQKLRSDGSVYILVPENGKYGTHTYPGSGTATALVIRAAFEKHVNRVQLSPEEESVELGLIKAKTQEFTYLVRPMILHWEERATEWLGKSDRVEVKIIVMDVKSGKIIDSVVIKGKSKWPAFGGDHPQDLLPEPIDRYVATLF
jgi:hypothetical protein